jgi:4-hydroxy-tetrahydrodipicolinate reductase
MNPIKVIIHGAAGKVGQEVVRAVCGESDMQLVGAVDLKAAMDSLPLPDGSGSVPFSTDLGDILARCQPDVMVDFSIARATMPAVKLAAEKGVSLVIGTTGCSPDDIKEIERLAAERGIGAVMAPNFALGAVLMMHLAKIAAKYLDYAEIIELHHHLKADAPSGTAQTTARTMAETRGKPLLQPQGKAAASRGEPVEGVSIHSVRLPGLMAHQEVILGAPGQTLSIRHDTINRECYMPGVIRAIREVVKRKGLVYGLDRLLGL